MKAEGIFDSTARRLVNELPERADTNAFGLVSLFWRRRWLLLTSTIVGTGLAVLAGMSMEPTYTASTMLMLNPHEARVLEITAVAEQFSVDTPSIETQLEVLNSRMLAKEVIKDFGLMEDSELNDDTAPNIWWASYVGAMLTDLMAYFWPSVTSFAHKHDEAGVATVLPSGMTSVPPDSSEETLKAFQQRLRIRQQGESYVIKVSFTSTDPIKAAQIANGVADRFINYQLNSKRLVTCKASEWLGLRLADLRQELQAGAQAAQTFSARNGIITANGIDIPDQELAEVAQSVVAARVDAAVKVAKVKMVEKLQADRGHIAAIPEVINSPLILMLRTQETELLRQEAELSAAYGNKHPKMQLIRQEKAIVGEKTSREIDRIMDNLRIEAQAAAARQASLERDMERFKATMAEKRHAEVQLADLQRESEATRQIYQQLLQRHKETLEQQDLVEPNVRVLSVAEPPAPAVDPGFSVLWRYRLHGIHALDVFARGGARDR